MNDKKNNYEFISIEFLNAPLNDIYNKKKHLIAGKELLDLKGRMSRYFMQIERLFREVYFSSVQLDENDGDWELFACQFPGLWQILKDKTNTIAEGEVSGIQSYLSILSELRNINLHSIISANITNRFRVSEEFLSGFPKISDDVCLSKNGTLTVAGMFAFLFVILDDKTRESLGKYIFERWGQLLFNCDKKEVWTKKEEFLAKLKSNLPVDYEVSIRKSKNEDDVLKAILGRVYDKTKFKKTAQNKLEFELDLSQNIKATRYCCRGEIIECDEECVLTIFDKSNMGVDYVGEYELHILDKKAFCQFCSMVPPMFSVGYLYKQGITRFDAETTSKLNIESYCKLNQPKFYRNKNIDILCYGSSNPDIREINRIISDNMLKVWLSFEEAMVFELGLMIDDGYSTLHDVLQALNVPKDLYKKVLSCRNFCAHEGMLERVSYGNQYDASGYLINLEFIQKVINELTVFLESKGFVDKARWLQKDFDEHIVGAIFGSKYKRIIEKSILLFRGAREMIPTNVEDMKKSINLARLSVITGQVELALSENKTKRMSFSLSPRLLELPDNKFKYKTLKMAKIEGDDLEVRGVKIGKGPLEFFVTPATVMRKISINGHEVSLIKVSEEETGIVTTTTYQAIEMK